MGSCQSSNGASHGNSAVVNRSATTNKRSQMMDKTTAGSASTTATVTTYNDNTYNLANTKHHNNKDNQNENQDDDKENNKGGSMHRGMGRRKNSRVGLDTMVEERRKEGHLVSNVVNIESMGNLSGRCIEDVYGGVLDGVVLGEGVAGLVRTVKHKATGLSYAAKILNLDRLLAHRQKGQDDLCSSISYLAQQQEALRTEISIMSQLDHPHIARLQEVYEDDDNIYLVQEVCDGGELFDLLDEQPDECFGEDEALRLVWQMLSALRYLHSKGVVHRDLKLENFLFSTKKHLQLKMIDFGLSKHFHHPGEILHDMVGTPYTVAPEVIRGQYDEKCDLWAMGVLAYMLLCGEPPFGGCGGPETLQDLRRNILAGKFSFDKPDPSIWESVSDDAKDFIRTLLVTDPQQRPSAEQAQKHPWISNYHASYFDPRTTMVSSSLVQALTDFKEMPITKRLMFEVVSFTLMQDQIAHIQMEFEKLDTEGLGELSLDSMRQVLSRKDVSVSEQNDGQDSKHKGRARQLSLSRPEVDTFFNRMKLGKTETRVHWHEFIAACLPTCNVDDRNLRIAFDRLDQDHNGYITFEEVVQMIARDADEDRDALAQAWMDSVEEYGREQQFSFEDFCRLIHSYA